MVFSKVLNSGDARPYFLRTSIVNRSNEVMVSSKRFKNFLASPGNYSNVLETFIKVQKSFINFLESSKRSRKLLKGLGNFCKGPGIFYNFLESSKRSRKFLKEPGNY